MEKTCNDGGFGRQPTAQDANIPWRINPISLGAPPRLLSPFGTLFSKTFDLGYTNNEPPQS